MNHIFVEIAIVVIVSALLAWAMLMLRQPIIIGYIAAGVILGPWGLRFVTDIDLINQISDIGITLLLFMAGITLYPGERMHIFGTSLLLTTATSLIFAALSALIMLTLGFTPVESFIGGGAMMFSSTILVVKLMPTITLHQQRMGTVSIAVLIVQDLIAILLISLIKGNANLSLTDGLMSILKGALLVAGALLLERFIVKRMIAQVERYTELLNLIVLAWCFSVSLSADALGLSHETGAFIGGLSLANNPISRYLSEELRFFRDFFLVLFFFDLGAQLDFMLIRNIALPALLLAVVMLLVKPAVFSSALRIAGENAKFRRELGVRLGQNSEFSFIIAFIAAEKGLLSTSASQLIQLTAIITMAASSYFIVSYYPSPLGSNKNLKID
jgi:Kef-type K+ transport system membrane component KefB